MNSDMKLFGMIHCVAALVAVTVAGAALRGIGRIVARARDFCRGGLLGAPNAVTEGINPKSHNAKHGGGGSRRKNGGAGCLKIKKIPRVFANFLKRIGQLAVFFRRRSSVAYRRSLPKRIFDICAFFIRFTKLTTCFLF